MSRRQNSLIRFLLFVVTTFLITGGLFTTLTSNQVFAFSPTATPVSGSVSPEEQLEAQMEWELSAHADTFDNGMGANTTCARCKSPQNWDSSQVVAAQEALDCGSCKRTPGAQRPELESGFPVPLDEWQNIQCNICHIPQDGSYLRSIAFWDQSSKAYISVQNSNELCAKCHEGKHGFEVIEEQESSTAHNAWECTRCHGSHGAPSSCEDCHNPKEGPGSMEHERHPSVNCTACHDNGGLSIWREGSSESKFYEEYVPLRFAHTLTSWPSHNLSSDVSCIRCHHPRNYDSPVLVPEISCLDCHPDGAVLFWCQFFPRDPDVHPGYQENSTP